MSHVSDIDKRFTRARIVLKLHLDCVLDKLRFYWKKRANLVGTSLTGLLH